MKTNRCRFKKVVEWKKSERDESTLTIILFSLLIFGNALAFIIFTGDIVAGLYEVCIVLICVMVVATLQYKLDRNVYYERIK